MPTPRHYATNAARQAAYRARQALLTPAARTQRPAPGAGPRRWARLLGQAQGLLEEIVRAMATHEAARSDTWHESARGERFTERLEALEEILDLLRDQTMAEHR